MSRPNQDAYEAERAEKKAQQIQNVELKERFVLIIFNSYDVVYNQFLQI